LLARQIFEFDKSINYTDDEAYDLVEKFECLRLGPIANEESFLIRLDDKAIEKLV
jgi:hypothetical protein